MLFVAEKRAALEVVLRRLNEIGLGHLAIDLHGADVSSKKVMAQVADALEKVRNAVPPESRRVHKQLVDRRTRLNEHVQRLHSKREPTGLSMYQMQGKILRIARDAESGTRWRGDELCRIDPDLAEHVQDLLGEAAGFESLFLRTDPSPWTGAKLRDGAAVQSALELVSRASAQVFPVFKEAVRSVTQETGLLGPALVVESRELLALLVAVQAKLQLYDAGIYTQPHDSILHDLAPAHSGAWVRLWACLTNSAYRRARKLVRGLRTADPAPAKVLFAELVKSADRRVCGRKSQLTTPALARLAISPVKRRVLMRCSPWLTLCPRSFRKRISSKWPSMTLAISLAVWLSTALRHSSYQS